MLNHHKIALLFTTLPYSTVLRNSLDPDSGVFWIRNNRDSEFWPDPDSINLDPKHCLEPGEAHHPGQAQVGDEEGGHHVPHIVVHPA